MESTQPPPQPTQQRPRLERLRSDRAVAGVASGLARYLNIDVAWVRIGFVLAAIFGGTGLLLYLVGWVAMPEEGENESIVADKAREFEGSKSVLGLGLIILAAVIVVGNSSIVDGELVFAAALVAVGVMLYRGDLGGNRDSEDPAAPPVSPASHVPEAFEVTAPIVEQNDSDPVGYASPPEPPVYPPLDPDPAFQPRPYESRESSPLGRFVFAGLLIVVGVMGVGQATGWFEPTLRHYVAAVFIVLGIGLLISSFFGRARWLVIPGLALAPLLVGASLLSVPFEGGFGDPHHAPQSAPDLEDEYRLIAGELVLDLSDLELAEDETYEVEASVVFGRLEVVVPPDLGVDVMARVDAGEMTLGGVIQNENVKAERSIDFEGSGDIQLDAHVGFGELVVHQVEETP
ncbi:MAG: PspC domain-containing protein [bacterium]|nr:PspC domain-containing protein [bacterium]